MSKEDLEKEAEEYANNLAFVFETDIVQRIVRERVRLALIDVLEPREKRIAELEEKLKYAEELQKQVKYYQAREQESGWTRFNELSHEEFCELMDFFNVAYEENTEVYKEACESVSNVWDRIAVARCGVWEMMFERMYIQAYRKGKDSEVQKQNGELTDKVKELEAQIEKMKCCGNCTKGNCVNIGQKGKACAYWTSNKLREIKENEYR